MNVSQEGLPLVVECDGIGPSGRINDDGVSARRTLDGDVQDSSGINQTKNRDRGGRWNRPGDLDETGRQQSGSGHDQGYQATDKTNDPWSFQWGSK